MLKYIRDTPSITRKVLSTRLHLSEDTVKYHLAKMKRAGKLARKGSTKSGQWIIMEDDTKW